MNILKIYKNIIKKKKYLLDHSQINIIKHLQKIYNEWYKNKKFLKNFFYKNKKNGLYIYGNIGSGKSFLMKLFFIKIKEKKNLKYIFMNLLNTFKIN